MRTYEYPWLCLNFFFTRIYPPVRNFFFRALLPCCALNFFFALFFLFVFYFFFFLYAYPALFPFFFFSRSVPSLKRPPGKVVLLYISHYLAFVPQGCHAVNGVQQARKLSREASQSVMALGLRHVLSMSLKRT